MALLTAIIDRTTRTTLSRLITTYEADSTIDITDISGEKIRPMAEQVKNVVFLTLDCLESENFKGDSLITEHPVEDGTDVSDHQVLKPKTVTIKGTMTLTPFNLFASVAGLVSSAGQLVGTRALGQLGGTLGSVAGGFAGKTLAGLLGESTEDRLKNVVTELINCRDSKRPVQIQTGLRQYPSEPNCFYLLQSFEVERNQSTGGSIAITMNLKEVITVSTKSVTIQYPKTIRGAKTVKQGKKTSDAASAASQKGASLGVKIFKGAGVIP